MRDDEITAHALAAGRGDADALTSFVRATQPDVWRYVAYLADRESADDLTQETFLRAVRGLRTFRGDVPARVWLLSIARRAVVDHFRKQGRTPVVAASLDRDPDVTDRISRPTPDPRRRGHAARPGRPPRPAQARRLRPHPDQRLVLRGGRAGLRRGDRDHPLPGRARP